MLMRAVYLNDTVSAKMQEVTHQQPEQMHDYRDLIWQGM
jgi:hypothetical protein